MLFKVLDEKGAESAISYIKKLNLNKRYDIEIKVRRELRSISQNKLYWLYLACICNETGNDKDYLHVFFGKKFLPQNSRVIYGETVNITVSTTSLDTVQFTHYLNRIQQFANAELGIALPNPEDLHFQDFLNTYKDFI